MTLHAPAPKTAAESALATAFSALAAGDAAKAAFADFERRGLPTRRDEAWHYTDLRAAMKRVQPLAAAADDRRLKAAEAALAKTTRIAAMRLVLVDGRYAESLSDAEPEGISLSVVEEPRAPEFSDAVVSLNRAFGRPALEVRVAANAAQASLEILHLDGPGAIYSRVDLELGAGAKLSVVERFEGGDLDTQRNALAFVRLGEGANCDWTTIVGDDAGLHLETPIVRLEADASFRNFGLVCGGALVRRQIDVAHSGPGVKIALSGLSLIDSQRHADTTLTVRHAAPRGESREFFRHIVADEGSGVYQGKVIVDPHAQKTDGGMKSQALLLSPTAEMDNKPELEIFADDVVCGHGATVGALDPEQVFYLQSRGIPRQQAEAMLLEAFGIEAIERVADEAVVDALRERLRAWLKRRAA
jgi:Fe-S cluster assembly protein SufD